MEYGAVIVLLSLVAAVLFLSGIPRLIGDGIGGSVDSALSGEAAPPGGGGAASPGTEGTEPSGSSDENSGGGSGTPEGQQPPGGNHPGAGGSGSGDGVDEGEDVPDSDGSSGQSGFDPPPTGTDGSGDAHLPGTGNGGDDSSSEGPSLIEEWWDQRGDEEGEESDSAAGPESASEPDPGPAPDTGQGEEGTETGGPGGECGWFMPEVCSIGGGLLEGGRDVTESLGVATCWFGSCDDEEAADSEAGTTGGSGESPEASGDVADDSPEGRDDAGAETGASPGVEEASENSLLRVLVAVLKPFRFLGDS